MKGENWYCGMVDVVIQNLDIICCYKVEYVVILVGDYIYKQDYLCMLIDYVEKGVCCMVVCMLVLIKEVMVFGVMVVDESDKIIDFVEKLVNFFVMSGDVSKVLVSMGIYVFDVDYLYELLVVDDKDDVFSYDFGKDIIFKIICEGMVYVYFFLFFCVQFDL